MGLTTLRSVRVASAARTTRSSRLARRSGIVRSGPGRMAGVEPRVLKAAGLNRGQ